MDKLYKKVGKRYVEVGQEFTGFPANGIWLVEDGKRSLITFLGNEKPQPFMLNYAVHKDGLVDRFQADWNGRQVSINDMAMTACDYFAEFALAQQLKHKDKRW